MISKEKRYIRMARNLASQFDIPLKVSGKKQFNIKPCPGGCEGKFVPTKTSPDMCIPCKYRNIKR